MKAHLILGDCRDVLPTLPSRSVSMCVTSPPYLGHRDYQVDGQMGQESSPQTYVDELVGVFKEVKRVLRDDGSAWLNLGDSYHNKQLQGIPWRVAFALQDDGWVLRSDIIWSKPNPIPESVRDRPTRSHEHLFLLTKRKRYYYDAHAIKEPFTSQDRPPGNKRRVIEGRLGEESGWNLRPSAVKAFPPGGRNKRDVWTLTTKPYKGAHFATFPPELVEPCILAGTSEGGCCSVCAAPYTRILEKGEPLEEQRAACGADANGEYHGVAQKDYAGAKAQDASATKARILAGMVERKTVGWDTSCECGEDNPLVGGPVPCTVLDPFGGAMTTGLVALQHGRDFIGVEISPEYIELSKRRLLAIS